MSSHYVKPGIAAIVLALLFPIYWSSIFIFGAGGGDWFDLVREEIQTFSGFDALFLLIGALEVYIYLSLLRTIENQLDSSFAKALLIIMMAAVALFHSLVMVDMYLAAFSSALSSNMVDSIVGISVAMSIITLSIYTIAGLILSVFLLMHNVSTNPMLKYFAVLLLLVCLLQITLFLAIVNLVLFPLALIILAVYFLKDPEMVEVV